MRKVIIIDTSILCVFLRVPKMETCGTQNEQWDATKVQQKLDEEEESGTTFVLPLASIIETGNHIAQATAMRWECARELADLMRKTANEQTPWAAFIEPEVLWSSKRLEQLADQWPELANQKISLGDATIKDVAQYYADSGFSVEIFTGDSDLKAHEPVAKKVPRRRR